MDAVWMVLVTVIVFLIVFFVAWGLGVKPLTAVALACVWTLLIQCLMFPSTMTNLDTFQWNGWLTVYAVLAAFFFIFLIVYVTIIATKDHYPKRHVVEKIEISVSGEDY